LKSDQIHGCLFSCQFRRTHRISNLTVVGENAAAAACDDVKVSVDVTNRGKVVGSEVVQVYLKLPEASVPTTRVRPVAFERVRGGLRRGSSTSSLIGNGQPDYTQQGH
jgi:hypothetical protein